MNKKIFSALLRQNFEFFMAKAFTTICPGNNYLPNWHIVKIAEYLEKVRLGEINRLIINMPPRYLKSVCISVAWPAWLLGKNPATKIMAASYSQVLSNKHSQDCRLLLNSDWYIDSFKETKITRGENQKSKFVTTSRGFRFATSTGGTATGEGGDILIVDDPQNPNKINSKKYREQTIEWFEQSFISRLNNKKSGAIVIVMQRLHAEDLCGYLLKNKADQWTLLKLPAILDEEEVLHSERESYQDLIKLKNEMGEYNFAAQYQQQPISSNGTMIKKQWFRYFSELELEKYSQIIQSWDTAIKAKDEHDFTVGITIGVIGDKYYILDIMRKKLEFPDLVKAVKEFAFKWKPKIILVEDKASGQSLLQSLSRSLPMFPVKPKFDKITRFACHTPLFETQRIFINEKGVWRIDLEAELLAFPKSANDDQIDALSQAFSYLSENKQSFSLRRL